MLISQRLQRIRGQALKRVTAAAESGSTADAERWSRFARECDHLLGDALGAERQILEVQQRLEVLEKAGRSGSPMQVEPGGGKVRARQVRDAVVIEAAQAGIKLQPGPGPSRIVYSIPGGKTLALPFAAEVPERRGQFFFGLPDDVAFDFAALICQLLGGERKVFVIPRSLVESAWTAPDKVHSQRKLHLQERGGRFLMHSGRRREPIDEFIGRWDLIRRS